MKITHWASLKKFLLNRPNRPSNHLERSPFKSPLDISLSHFQKIFFQINPIDHWASFQRVILKDKNKAHWATSKDVPNANPLRFFQRWWSLATFERWPSTTTKYLPNQDHHIPFELSPPKYEDTAIGYL